MFDLNMALDDSVESLNVCTIFHDTVTHKLTIFYVNHPSGTYADVWWGGFWGG